MQTIILAGWRAGLQKTALASLQREVLHLSLKEAKENVDQLLEAEEGKLPARPVALQVPEQVAVEFAQRADELGALIGFVSFSTATVPRPQPAAPGRASSQQAA